MKKPIILCTALLSFCFFSQSVFAQSSDSVTPAQAQVLRDTLVTEAKKYVGCPYQSGGIGPDSFDCSGFVYYVARQSIQYQLPRMTKNMYNSAKVVPDSRREPGDLVFFKTTGDGSISHVGIYIGKNQFIHSASDGPNTGVILSSLNESYWKAHYSGAGQFLPSGREDGASSEEENFSAGGETGSDKNASVSRSGDYKKSSGNTFLDHLEFDAALSCDWSFFTSVRFMPNFRGIAAQANISYTKWDMKPGIGGMFRYNAGVHAFQFPVVFDLTFSDYVRAYAGPVFTIGDCTLPDTDDEIKASIFPGIIGFSWMTPSFTKKDVKIQIMQDLCYTVFNRTDNAALSPLESFSAGLVLSTGIRVTFPFSVFTK